MQKTFSGNQLKIIAAVAMTIDHIGVMLFPDLLILRIIGRIAMPIFAYMIAEGCYHTKNKKRYALTLFAVALVCQIVYFVAMKSLAQSILTTFLLSVILIFSYEKAHQKRDFKNVALFVSVLIGAFLICEILPVCINGFSIDYGFAGATLPLLVFIGRTKKERLALCAVGLAVLTIVIKEVQIFSFFSLLLLSFYDGTRGERNLKYFFYIYYPLHLAVIYFIGLFF